MEKSRELFPDYDYSHIIGYDAVDGDDWWNKMKDSLPALIKQLTLLRSLYNTKTLFRAVNHTGNT